jgi:hypothetical protein
MRGIAAWLGLTLLVVGILAGITHAVDQSSGFWLQVSPSPLVATIKPGETKELELKIRNAGAETEELKIESRKFSVNNQTGEVHLDDVAPSEIAQWVTYSAPKFTVKPGEWYTQKIRVALPKQSGFSYSLALIISRVQTPKATESGRLIKGSVAVFTLLNVDRPGAVRKLDVTEFMSDQSLYEYLPAKFNMLFKNTGNTIVQPYGNVFIQRGSNDASPIATLPVNDKGGYLLPDTPRTLSTTWNTGFPVYESNQADESSNQQLQWDWSKIANFRIGPYTAKLVAIYNDGERDVPIEREVTFWVIPWRAILIIAAVIGILLYLRHKQIQRKTRKAVQKAP